MDKNLPLISIIVSVYNEEKNIEGRIKNLLEQDYPPEKMEIIVASDGSTDRTVEIAGKYKEKNVIVLDFKENRGRAAVHNDAVNITRGEILIFTDAETSFEKGFLKEIINPFYREEIGCVVGNLIYLSEDRKSAIGSSEGIYFRFEKFLRKLESDLCVLATGTGACMAVRKKLWKKLYLTDDVDFTTPLDVILQGYKVVYNPKAIAYDLPYNSIRSELNARIRQTSKNLFGTLKKMKELPLKVNIALISHKIIRWFTFMLMTIVLITNFILVPENYLYKVLLFFQLSFYVCGAVGAFFYFKGMNIPICSQIFSFIIAIIGMFVGVVKVLLGRIPARYGGNNG